MAERKTLTITEVGEIQKIGERQAPKLPFKATDGNKELSYHTWRTSLFDAIKEGATIQADVEVKQEGDWINRRIVQIYVDGQPIGGRKEGGYRGKSPQELELSARSYALAYAKDLAVAGVIKLDAITVQADIFYKWLNKNKPKAPPDKLESEIFGEYEAKTEAPSDLKQLKFKNAGEFYTACLDHLKLSKSKVDAEVPEYDLTKADQRAKAWEQILGVYRQTGEQTKEVTNG